MLKRSQYLKNLSANSTIYVVIFCNQYVQGVAQDANNVLLNLLHGSDGGNSNFYTRLPCHGILIKKLHLFVPIFHISMSERISSVLSYVEVEKTCLVWQGYLTAAYFVFAVTWLFLRYSHDVGTFFVSLLLETNFFTSMIIFRSLKKT